jgi:hypothetical protein
MSPPNVVTINTPVGNMNINGNYEIIDRLSVIKTAIVIPTMDPIMVDGIISPRAS